MEVMGLMLGEFVDDYTVKVVDVFAMPQVRGAARCPVPPPSSPNKARAPRPPATQSGTGVSVEAVDPVFQTKMLDMLKQTGRHDPRHRSRAPSRLALTPPGLLSPQHRPEMVVGWYHSHPGFGCWLSGVDINTQQSFEALNARAVSIVVDPVQSVKGKVVIDAFRLINPQTLMLGQEPRQTTSNLGHLNKPSIQALIHGLNRHYYSLGISYRKNPLEEQMLLNLHKKRWSDGLQLERWDERAATNAAQLSALAELAGKYDKAVQEEETLTPEKLAIAGVGRQDAKKRLEAGVQILLSDNICQTLGSMLDVIVF